MIYVFLFYIYIGFYAFFEVVFNAFARLFKWYDVFVFNHPLYSMEGYTSLWSAISGGVSCLIIYCLQQYTYLYTMIYAGFIIIIIELITGIICNILLKMKLWNYKNEKFNFIGQITLFRSIGWYLTGIIIVIINKGIMELLK